jgi:hypothetical protein
MQHNGRIAKRLTDWRKLPPSVGELGAAVFAEGAARVAGEDDAQAARGMEAATDGNLRTEREAVARKGCSFRKAVVVLEGSIE